MVNRGSHERLHTSQSALEDDLKGYEIDTWQHREIGERGWGQGNQKSPSKLVIRNQRETRKQDVARKNRWKIGKNLRNFTCKTHERGVITASWTFEAAFTGFLASGKQEATLVGSVTMVSGPWWIYSDHKWDTVQPASTLFPNCLSSGYLVLMHCVCIFLSFFFFFFCKTKQAVSCGANTADCDI